VEIPQLLIQSLHRAAGFNHEAFEELHRSGEQVTSVRVNTYKPSLPYQIKPQNIPQLEKVPWSQFGYYLPERPSFTFDPFFHAGSYYVQEASSMFLEQVFIQHVDLKTPLRVLDLSAAPGGKSTHIQSLLSAESLLVSNEVIRSRSNILRDNIIKWGTSNVAVTQNDPKDFNRLENYFDVIVIDAPCSGSGLFRRDPQAIREWSIQNVELCSQRQQRIIGDIWPALKHGGILIYSTCSYSQKEDEAIVDWMKKDFQLNYLPIQLSPSWNIVDTGSGYRFWPYDLKGEGFFLACFKKTGGDVLDPVAPKNKIDYASRKEVMVIEEWMKSSGVKFIKHLNTVYAWPDSVFEDLSFLLRQLRIIYSGFMVGEVIRDKLVPAHSFAMTHHVSGTVPRVSLDYEATIRFLQRKELNWPPLEKGWHLVEYEGKTLGWANVISRRVNNYYPKELRILKDR
jgi:16S rRNA C967 or C1407 C5-methylase (RsmB/RsmF family)/NOL1/NOP2/fmu family ribosome biogenesis protein